MEVGFLTVEHYLSFRWLGPKFEMVCQKDSLQSFKK